MPAKGGGFRGQGGFGVRIVGPNGRDQTYTLGGDPTFRKGAGAKVSFGTWAPFRWKGKFCPDSEASSCWLGHGNVFVMDGQCQDEFLHCTDPGLEQERIYVTFRWIRQHASCPLRTGAVCCLPTCAQCSSVAVTEIVVTSGFGAFWVFFGTLCMWEEGKRKRCTSSAGLPLMCTGLGVHWAEVGGGIIFVTYGEFTGMHKSSPVIS